jgi:peptide-methionine (S)-S-oxide reductase
MAACSGSSPAERQAPPVAASTAPAPADVPPAPAPISVKAPAPSDHDQPTPMAQDRELATFAAGCFWCVEAVLEQLPGVLDVESGYTGGAVAEPTYQQVCSGETGHAEAVRVTFDPSKISYDTLLDWFFKLHDPTTLNRQGNDVGTQYRSAIFWHDEAQRAAAEKKKAALEASGKFRDPIVTEVVAADRFYEAEGYYQDYYRFNKSKNPYCRVVITPKLDKLGLEK